MYPQVYGDANLTSLMLFFFQGLFTFEVKVLIYVTTVLFKMVPKLGHALTKIEHNSCVSYISPRQDEALHDQDFEADRPSASYCFGK